MPKHAFFPTTLRGRLLALAAVAALPAIFVAIAGVALYRDRLNDHLAQHLTHETEAAAARVGMVLSNANALLSVLLADDSALRMDEQECSRFVSRVAHNQNDLAGLGLIDAHSKVVCAPDMARLGVTVSDRPYVREVLKSGKPVLSSFSTGRVSREPVLISGRPMVGVDGAIRAVAYASVRQSALIAAAMEGVSEAPVYLVDQAGNVLSTHGTLTAEQVPAIVRGQLLAKADQQPG